MRDALHRLEPLWEELFPAEQARIVRLLVERIELSPDGKKLYVANRGSNQIHGKKGGPGSVSVVDLLASSGTDTSRLDGGATIVWSPATGTAVDAAAAAEVQPMLQSFADLASVSCITTPFDPSQVVPALPA